MSKKKRWEKYRDHDSRRWLRSHQPRYSDPYRYLKPRDIWIDEVRATISAWRELKQEYDALLLCPSFRSGRCGQSAEQAVMMALPRKKQERYDALCAAVRMLGREEDGRDKVKLVQMLYRHRTHGVVTAATALGISEGTARRWIVRFQNAVALNLGYGGASGG